MPDGIAEKMGVEAFVGGWRQFENQMKSMQKATDKTGDSLDRFAGKGEKQRKGLLSLQNVLGAVAAAYGAMRTAQGAIDFVRFGAGVQRQADALESQAEAAGTSGDAIVAAIRRASDFTIDRMTAMEVANSTLITEVAQTPEEFERLANVSIRLGRVMGRSSTEAINDFVIAAARKSTLIADNLGLLVRTGEANAKYAAQIGVTAKELTAAQQSQAFLNEMLAQGEDKLGTIGDQAGDTATNIEALDSALKDLKTTVALYIAEQAKGATSFLALAMRLNEQRLQLRLLQDELKELNAITREEIRENAEAELRWRRQRVSAENMAIQIDEVSAKIAEYNQRIARIRTAQEHLTETTDSVSNEQDQLEEAMRHTMLTMDSYTRQLEYLISIEQHHQRELEKAIELNRRWAEAQGGLNDILEQGTEEYLVMRDAYRGGEDEFTAFIHVLRAQFQAQREAKKEAQELAEEIEALAEEAYQAAAAEGDIFIGLLGEATDETDIFALALFQATDAAGGNIDTLAALAGALGIYTEAEVAAAVAAATLQVAIADLGEQVARGTLTVIEAVEQLQELLASLPAGAAEAFARPYAPTPRTGVDREADRRRREAERARREAERAREREERAMRQLIALTGDYFVDAVGEAAEGTDEWALALFESADAAGASAEQLALLAGALGIYTEEQVEAALAAAAMQVKLDELGRAIAEGLGIEEAMERLRRFRDELGFEVEEPVDLITVNELIREYNRLLRGGAETGVLAALLAEIQRVEAAGGAVPAASLLGPVGTMAPSQTTATMNVGPNYLSDGMDLAALRAVLKRMWANELQ